MQFGTPPGSYATSRAVPVRAASCRTANPGGAPVSASGGAPTSASAPAGARNSPGAPAPRVQRVRRRRCGWRAGVNIVILRLVPRICCAREVPGCTGQPEVRRNVHVGANDRPTRDPRDKPGDDGGRGVSQPKHSKDSASLIRNYRGVEGRRQPMQFGTPPASCATTCAVPVRAASCGTANPGGAPVSAS